eukprot:TRINITY_DN2065_c0_g1_i17.p1 TRINITY_DN2065_c0_g1~~TRINITY_DN2065_c0_g1_i17.p1  ORF type:complete len:337 (+),score=48.64 TRINITY_DN2065_c0_g1_i17:95-1105(+)
MDTDLSEILVQLNMTHYESTLLSHGLSQTRELRLLTTSDLEKVGIDSVSASVLLTTLAKSPQTNGMVSNEKDGAWGILSSFPMVQKSLSLRSSSRPGQTVVPPSAVSPRSQRRAQEFFSGTLQQPNFTQSSKGQQSHLSRTLSLRPRPSSQVGQNVPEQEITENLPGQPSIFSRVTRLPGLSRKFHEEDHINISPRKESTPSSPPCSPRENQQSPREIFFSRASSSRNAEMGPLWRTMSPEPSIQNVSTHRASHTQQQLQSQGPPLAQPSVQPPLQGQIQTSVPVQMVQATQQKTQPQIQSQIQLQTQTQLQTEPQLRPQPKKKKKKKKKKKSTLR